VGGTYDHPQIKLPERPTIIDVGANIGLFTIWAASKHRPRTIRGLAAVDLLKIDVEGHFMEVLHRARRHDQDSQYRAGGGVRGDAGALRRCHLFLAA
jgi:hypothetical protein